MRREKKGCWELIVALIVLYAVWQIAVVSLKVVHEAFLFASTLLKWIGLGLAGAGGLLAVGAAAFGAVWGVQWLWNRWTRGREEGREAYRARYWHYLRASEWQRGIVATARRLRHRKWLSKKDATHYCDMAEKAVTRLRALDEDLALMETLTAGENWASTMRDGAGRILQHLERTHHALLRLLAESAVQRIPAVEMDLEEASVELQALSAALEDLTQPGKARPGEEWMTPEAASAARAVADESERRWTAQESELQR